MSDALKLCRLINGAYHRATLDLGEVENPGFGKIFGYISEVYPESCWSYSPFSMPILFSQFRPRFMLLLHQNVNSLIGSRHGTTRKGDSETQPSRMRCLSSPEGEGMESTQA